MIRFKHLSCFSMGILLLYTTATTAQTLRHPQLPQAVQEIYPTLYQGKIWLAGGISSSLPPGQGQMTAQVHFWAPGMANWQQAPSLPEGRHHTYLQAIGDKLFAFGGFINSTQGQWHNTADVLLLDNTTGNWQKVAKMPAPLSETTGAVINGKIHLAGGRSPTSKDNGQWQQSRDVNWHWIFDPASYQFTHAAPLPTARNSAATVQLDGRWLILGGRTIGGPNLTEVLEYQSDTDRWQSFPAMPEGRAGHAAAISGDKIQVYGGEHDKGVYSSVLQFDPATKRWQVIGNWPQARHGLGAISLDGQTWLLGGATATGLQNTSAKFESTTEVLHIIP